MPIEHEIEAKLLVPRVAELERIAALRRLGSYRLLPRRRARLVTTYLDTAELALLAAGVCLRVRRDGERYEATAKWMGAVVGAVHSRPELTVQLVRAPRSKAGFELPEGPLHDQLVAIVAGRELAPILVTHIDRRVIDVLRRGARGQGAVVAELALDRVRSELPARRARKATEYGELELELRGGTLEELTTLADRLRLEYRLEPTHETKFSRGMDAVHGPGLLAARRVAPEPPGPRETIGQALRRALGVQLARIRANDPGTRAGEDREPLHQQRVGVRRARSVLRAFGDALPPRRHDFLRRELRWLGGALGTVRDLDVQLSGCEQLAVALPDAERAALQAHAQTLRVERVEQRQRMLRALDDARYFQLLLELEALSTERDVHPAAPERALLLSAEGGARAERALSVLRKRGHEVAADPEAASAQDLHGLRIRARRTRYLLEVFAELTGAPGRRVVEQLVRMQDRLGQHQDAVVAAAAIALHRERLGALGRPEPRRGLERLAARERRRAARARLDFARAFRRFDRQWGDVERMLARLADVTERAAEEAST